LLCEKNIHIYSRVVSFGFRIKMKGALSAVLLVALFGNVFSGYIQGGPSFLVQPAVAVNGQQYYNLVAAGTEVQAAETSAGGYRGAVPPPPSSSYGAPSGGYNAPAPAPGPGAGAGAGSGAGAQANAGGGYSTINSGAGGGDIDSFADPRNRGPEKPKSQYGAPPVPGAKYGAPLGSSADNFASADGADGGSDFNKDELDAALRDSDVVGGSSGSGSSGSSTTEAAADDDFPEIDFTPPRRSLLQRFWSFITKQFSNIMAFLRRIWNRVRGTSS
jgi:hypothetical protein